jgi:hypothetical protein
VFALHAAMAAQLEAAGLPQWAVFVALHLPDEPAAGGGGGQAPPGPAPGARRTRLVRELLRRHAAAWAADAAAAEAFLVRRLRLPRAWLADALAGWARARGDVAGAPPARPAARAGSRSLAVGAGAGMRPRGPPLQQGRGAGRSRAPLLKQGVADAFKE